MAIARTLFSLVVAVAITTATIGCGNSSGGVDPKQSDVGVQNTPEVPKQVPGGLTPKQQQVREASKGKDDD